MTEPVDLSASVRTGRLGQWLDRKLRYAAEVEIGTRQALAGGVGSPLVERVELVARGEGHPPVTVDVVAKRASSVEVLALRESAAIPGADAFPELIDAGTDAFGPWVVMPFYPGGPLPWDAELPEAVYVSLARYHLRYLGRTAALPAEFRRVDLDFCLHALLDFAPTGIRTARDRDPHPVHRRALELLRHWARERWVRAGLDLLPATLLHGDVYGLNVLASHGGTPPRLVDWGSGRIGPVMLDVVLSADILSDGMAAYLHTWELVAGRPLGAWEAAAGHAWATAFSDAMFVGAVAERFGPDHAQDLLDKAEAAAARFVKLLVARP
jgi:hypothetical protein